MPEYHSTERQPRVEVEALLVSVDKNNLQIQTDETAKPFWIPRTGIQMSTVKKKIKDPTSALLHIKLRLCENKAIAYGLA